MSNLQESIQRASEQIKQAVTYEAEEKPQQALECYRRGLARFGLVLDCNRANKQLCATLRERMTGYQEQADRLAAQLTVGEASGELQRGGGEPSEAKVATGSQYEQRLDHLARPVHWDDIVGLRETKRLLRETVLLPRELAHLYVGIREAPRAILLYGAPGNGKTELVRALATEMMAKRAVAFYTFSGADIISKWLGESARNIKELFQTIRANKPAILFIDEIESICSKRSEGQDGGSGGQSKALNELLIQLDGLCGDSMEDVLLIGATNLPWVLDTAMLRRMAARVYVPMPDREMREALFARLLGKNEHALESSHFGELAELSEGYSASDITNVCKDAAVLPLRRVVDATRFHKAARGDFMEPCGADCARDPTHQCIESRYEWFTDKSILLAPPIAFADLLDSIARQQVHSRHRRSGADGRMDGEARPGA